MKRYLLDTNVISEPMKLRPSPSVLEGIRRTAGAVAVSSTIVHELWFGVERLPRGSRKRSELERYVREIVEARIEILPYDARAARWHAERRVALAPKTARRTKTARRGAWPHTEDMQIAAVAAVHGLVVVTRNVKDFRSLGVPVEDWFLRAPGDPAP